MLEKRMLPMLMMMMRSRMRFGRFALLEVLRMVYFAGCALEGVTRQARLGMPASQNVF